LFSAENIDFQKERFRLVSKKETRKRLSIQLKEANGRLRELVAGSDQVAAAREKRDRPSTTPMMNQKLQEYWRHAKRLYDALAKAADIHPTRPQCRCAGHIANLQLTEKEVEKIEFGILFSGMDQGGGLSWSKTRIEMTSNGKIDDAIVARGAQLAGPERPPRRVGFVDPNSGTQSSRSPRTNARPIQHLCIELSKPLRACIGFMDEDEQRFMVYPEKKGTMTEFGGSIITLDSMLCTSPSLTRRQRYRLAHTIASWFLRLGSTPWITLPIQANIVFFQDARNGNTIDIDKMYIGGELTDSPSIPTLDALRSLGVCLLELCFGCSLNSYKDRNNLSGNVATALASLLDHAAAVQWSQDVYEEAGPEFAEAIEWCLQVRGQNDESWRKDIWTHVIFPLDNCRKYISQRPHSHTDERNRVLIV
jgi:hypothetical protein